PYAVTNGSVRVTENQVYEEHALFGSHMVYYVEGGDLYLYDIPSQRSRWLAHDDGFRGELDYDGRYVVYESVDGISYIDLYTGVAGLVTEDGDEPFVRDGKVVYHADDEVYLYTFATDETQTIPLHPAVDSPSRTQFQGD